MGTAAVVIGPGRVGRAISSFYDPPARLLGRGQQLPREVTTGGTPVWVCTTNDGLDSVLQHTTAAAREQRRQLVFVHNGMLLPWLAQHGLQHNTQVLLYMSATEDGTVTDGHRTAVCGPFAQHVASTLLSNNVRCEVVRDWQLFRQLMLVKLLWACVFWLLSAGLGGKPVGHIAQHHQAEVSGLVAELLPLGQQYLHDFEQQQQQQRDGDDSRKQGSSGLAAFAGKMPLATGSNRGDTPSGNGACKRIGAAAGLLGISSGSRCGSNGAHGRGHDAAVSSRFFFSHDAVMQQLLSYSQAISAAVPSMDMARREFAWRNGFFLGLPQGRTPLHVDWLQRAGCGDLLAA